MEDVGVTEGFWSKKRVLITGHTGFKGAWLALWLELLGAEVHGVALPPEDPEGAYLAMRPELASDHVDLRNAKGLAEVTAAIDPEIVFHLAAQSLVRRSYEDPGGTYEVNVLGTLHLLKALSAAPSSKSLVISTTDKVYRNDELGRPFVEEDPLGGYDPYSSSKACVEILVESWARSFRSKSPTKICTARAGNVIGGGDWARDRLVPDLFRSLKAEKPLTLRYPEAIRPWQFVLQPLMGYLMLAEHMHASRKEAVPTALNFGPGPEGWARVRDVVEQVVQLWGAGTWARATDENPPESLVLTLDSSRATKLLGWRSRMDLRTAVKWTVEWRKAQLAGHDMREFSIGQIEEFQGLMA